MGVDPELALRSSARRFRARVEEAARLAGEEGAEFERLSPGEQLRLYGAARART
jgi:XTP/dITP diphosphohydrolase/tetrapyrrole methylase family protein/MazG family protein/ATP diphosphatase